jgi:hypothetical protein
VRQGRYIGIRDRPIRESGRVGVRACWSGWPNTDQLLVGRGRSVGLLLRVGKGWGECQKVRAPFPVFYRPTVIHRPAKLCTGGYPQAKKPRPPVLNTGERGVYTPQKKIFAKVRSGKPYTLTCGFAVNNYCVTSHKSKTQYQGICCALYIVGQKSTASSFRAVRLASVEAPRPRTVLPLTSLWLARALSPLSSTLRCYGRQDLCLKSDQPLVQKTHPPGIKIESNFGPSYDGLPVGVIRGR